MVDGKTKSGNEIERKFLLLEKPFGYKMYPSSRIEQTYLSYVGTEHRIRKMGGKCYETYKSDGALCREEKENRITPATYHERFKQRMSRVIKKRRYFIPVEENLVVELDVFHGIYEGLVMAEIEFDSLETAQSFVPFSMFDVEVTNDKRFKNKNLATMTDSERQKLFVDYNIPTRQIKGTARRKRR